jgi:hypothetical protein
VTRRPSLPRYASDERHADAWARENPAQAQALAYRQAMDRKRAERRQRIQQALWTLAGAIAMGALLAWFGTVNAGNMRKPPPPPKAPPPKAREAPPPAPPVIFTPDGKVRRT